MTTGGDTTVLVIDCVSHLIRSAFLPICAVLLCGLRRVLVPIPRQHRMRIVRPPLIAKIPATIVRRLLIEDTQALVAVVPWLDLDWAADGTLVFTRVCQGHQSLVNVGGRPPPNLRLGGECDLVFVSDAAPGNLLSEAN